MLKALTVSAATFTVTSDADTGSGTLREAIQNANTTPGQDTIRFNIPGAGQQIIRPLSPLPDIVDPILIDGYTQPGSLPNEGPVGFNAVLPIVLRGDLAGAGADGLRFLSASNVVRGLSIALFNGDQIKLIAGGGNVIEGNMIGDTSGSSPFTAVGNGIHIVAPTFDLRSLSEYNVIGGEIPAAKNLISGNSNGIRIVNSTGNKILGNVIGVKLGDYFPQPNFANGIELLDTSANHYIRPTNYVGGSTLGARNVISGNGVANLTTNGHGIRVVDSAVLVAEGNYIGVEPAGFAAIPNLGDGIAIYRSFAPYHIIGGSTPGEGNIISGNGRNGIGIYSSFAFNDKSAAILIRGNTIGLTPGGARRANMGNAIYLADATAVIIGSPPGAGNTISANAGYGILLTNSVSNIIRGNRIGTDPGGVQDIGNGLGGILLTGMADGSMNNSVGGTIQGQGNIIAFNSGPGVAVTGNGTGNAIEGNAIFSNAQLGIDLGASGVTTNDPGDLDSGPNRLQNYPLITAAYTNTSSLIICGQTTSTRLQSLRLEFFGDNSCDPSGAIQGRIYLGSTIVYLGPTGESDFIASVSLPSELPLWLTATATDNTGNTSEFAPCTYVGSAPPQFSLHITQGTNASIITWPANASGFVLERTTTLAPPISWEPVTNGISQLGTNRTFSNTNSSPLTNVFFRLKKS